MNGVLLQNISTHETRAIRHAQMLSDQPGLHLQNASIEMLGCYGDALSRGQVMPVGSVEFVREAMRVGKLREPEPLSYPPALKEFLHREVIPMRAGSILGRWFVKPVETKRFTGFVFDTMEDPADLSEHDQEQHAAFMAMHENDMVWRSEPLEFVSEWRYYVMDGKIVGEARYDDGEDTAPSPDVGVTQEAINRLGLAHPYALDMGVLSDGQSALVEVNDAWAIGLYGAALSPISYLSFLSARWESILAGGHA